MDLLNSGITALVTLLAVMLGGWLSTRAQDRLWRRDHARQWRDIRLATYRDFLTAFREYIAFMREPTASITTAPHPRKAGVSMPFFDEAGRPYVERLEAAKTAARLVSEWPQTVNALDALVAEARTIASARATHGASDVPAEAFEALWAAERQFLAQARRELGLPAMAKGESGWA
ncbi:hypothetical protein [Kitasatospora viridis]|uniref:Uncharacterized protein n=1 Tax=Kitasatospora viridis TaxID=281105 RepID=A0A561S9C4_9ACTN|nr:hypothetical protein [Kitasatospora viridis]TWF71472.1 hypothetical protein FHX73_19102 [Kitasatospora viridis]